AVRAALAHELLHPPRQVELGSPDESLLGERRERIVRQTRDVANRRQLAVVLPRAQLLDEPAPRHERDPRIADALPAPVVEPTALEPDARAVQPLADGVEQEALRLDELDALDRARGLGVAKVREQQRLLVADEQRRVRALQSRQVAHVDARRDEQRL